MITPLKSYLTPTWWERLGQSNMKASRVASHRIAYVLVGLSLLNLFRTEFFECLMRRRPSAQGLGSYRASEPGFRALLTAWRFNFVSKRMGIVKITSCHRIYIDCLASSRDFLTALRLKRECVRRICIHLDRLRTKETINHLKLCSARLCIQVVLEKLYVFKYAPTPSLKQLIMSILFVVATSIAQLLCLRLALPSPGDIVSQQPQPAFISTLELVPKLRLA